MESPATSNAMVFFRNRKRQFDAAEAFRRHLLVFRLDRGAGADAAHDRH